MATTDYPSFLPDDFRGLKSIPDGNRRVYYKPKDDGTNQLYGEIIGNGHVVMRYPEGSTIEVLPENSVGTEQIKDGAVELDDLNDDVKEKMTNTYDSDSKKLTLGGIAG